MKKLILLVAVVLLPFSLVANNFNSPAKMEQRKITVEAVVKKMKMYEKVKIPGYEIFAGLSSYYLCPAGQKWCGDSTSIISFQYKCGGVDCDSDDIDFEVIIDPQHPGQRDFISEPVKVYIFDGKMSSPSISVDSDGYGRRCVWEEYSGDAEKVYKRVEEAIQEFLAAEPLRN